MPASMDSKTAANTASLHDVRASNELAANSAFKGSQNGAFYRRERGRGW